MGAAARDSDISSVVRVGFRDLGGSLCLELKEHASHNVRVLRVAEWFLREAINNVRGMRPVSELHTDSTQVAEKFPT